MKRKRFLTTCFCILSLTCSAENISLANEDGVTIYYDIYGSTATVLASKDPNGYSGRVVIPESIVYDEKEYIVTRLVNTFQNNVNLTSVRIPKSVCDVDCPFRGCTSLQSIEVDPENQDYTAKDNVLFTKDMSKLIAYGSPEETYSIPQGVTTISDYAFSNSHVRHIMIPASVELAGGMQNVPSLESVTFLEGFFGTFTRSCIGAVYKRTSSTQEKEYWYENIVYNLKSINCKMSEASVFGPGHSDSSWHDYLPAVNHTIVYVPEGKYWDYVWKGWGWFVNIKETASNVASLNAYQPYMISDSHGLNFIVCDRYTGDIKTIESINIMDEQDPYQNWIVKDKCLYNIGAQKYAVQNADGSMELSDIPNVTNFKDSEEGISINGVVKSFVLNGKVDYTGIHGIQIDNSEAPVMVYDLNGRQISNLNQGINIMTKGESRARKVLIE